MIKYTTKIYQNPLDKERTTPAFSRALRRDVLSTCTMAPTFKPLAVFTRSYEPATTVA